MLDRLPRGWPARLVILAVAAAIVVVAAIVILGAGRGTDPARLAVGDCFDVPQATDRIGDVRRRGCSGAHDGEVFLVYDAADLPAPGYPTDPEWEALIHPVCDPEFEGYTGTPIAERLDIDYRYLVPTEDRWTAGDRRVTCFIVASDGAPLTISFRATP